MNTSAPDTSTWSYSLRTNFYALSPDETYYESVWQVPNMAAMVSYRSRRKTASFPLYIKLLEQFSPRRPSHFSIWATSGVADHDADVGGRGADLEVHQSRQQLASPQRRPELLERRTHGSE